VAADGLRKAGGASLLTFETGDEVAGLAFEFAAFTLDPFADASNELARAWKGADVLIQIDLGEEAALDASVVFFPVATPFVGNSGKFALRELVEGELVVFES